MSKSIDEQIEIDRLIEALQIFKKYIGTSYPTNCSHDQLYVDVRPDDVNEADIKRLDELGFFVDEELDGFSSFEFGSC